MRHLRHRRKVGLFFLLIGSSCLFGLHFYLLDGLPGTLFSLVATSDTVYAPGYSDEKFRSIHNGMIEGDVYSLMGTPIEVWIRSDGHWRRVPYGVMKTNDIQWNYSASPSDKSYFRRVIQFRNGNVTGKVAEFYLD